MMWPTILVLLGVLFLLDNFNALHFDRSWPLILIVAGAVWVLQSSASISGHVEPAPPMISGIAAAPPPPPTSTPATGDDKQVHHG
jgi:cell wall-active antibiotic response 4TMS protein YvqF